MSGGGGSPPAGTRSGQWRPWRVGPGGELHVVEADELRPAEAVREADMMLPYLRKHPEVNSVLITGGDPMVMKTQVPRRYIEPLLHDYLSHIVSIRIGTKAPGYWPGRNLALMAYYSHPVELSTTMAQAAIERLRNSGATIRCQAPLIRHVNDDAEVWASLWKRQLTLGAIPYYMFVERDTGPRQYFEVPLGRAFEIFTGAYRRVSGLGRTVRGPSMSATPGKVLIDGVVEIRGEKVFALKFIQARNPDWVNRMFFATYDAHACWLDELRPAFGEGWWWQEGMDELVAAGWTAAWSNESHIDKHVSDMGHVAFLG